MSMTESGYAKNSDYAKIKRTRGVISQALQVLTALLLSLLSAPVIARTPSALCNTLATYDESVSIAGHD